ncbi:type I-F CRISPR-associated helicase Cas3f [Azohydromonas caseinilytica]|uniref:Type I-F CRISPR-associated helicase Cas3 n=1 Tax=Azohydromonas caseinilytica TaxID=2728836 RepID=A0A848FB44_9BURK|nr:type I-F CRISPR-associated helicase Cas3f [Azohydromonas caseinilytica]NML15975.1 type I-F CRISPR-associated helicase Cas3 [Azohydromonas caseinilytica]
MNVLLISQCEKKALTETRRILDQFAERRGDRSWQTAITQEGLDTLRRLLRKTARKNTAVACHWIRGLDHSELLWTVGDARRFNAQGAVPTNTTTSNVLRTQDENDWHSGEDIDLLAALAALLHDLGKACVAFQKRLDGKWEGKNDYRHEWVSLRLFEAFVGQDNDVAWLTRLCGPEAGRLEAWIGKERFQRDQPGQPLPSPFKSMVNAPLAQAVGWLVVTHHRLPVMPRKRDDGSGYLPLGARVPGAGVTDLKDVLLQRLQADWNELPDSTDPKRLKRYWEFEQGLPVTTEHWQRQARRIAQRLLQLVQRPDRTDCQWLSQPYVIHLARLALMLADHHYSSLEGKHAERVKADEHYPLFANTDKDGQPNQRLDEHLIGVAKVSRELAHALPRFAQALPRLGKCAALRRRAGNERFRWQDKAADLAAGLRERSRRQGAFIVNMASTGCGKTVANARVMYALADPELGLRCAFAMGLRTLTLQTGRELRAKLGVGDDELAIRVGGTASRELFELHEAQAEKSGSASRQALLDEDSPEVDFLEGRDGDPLLRRVFRDPNARKLLEAPLLVCTIDHLTPATESQRGGRQIAPMLRLLGGDLVLDEPDDFGLEDLPALTRLVHWAGLLGSRVLLSSATLPPSLVQGLFEAYRHGRAQFNRHRSDRPSGTDAPAEVCCAWIDEFDREQADCASAEAFKQAHEKFTRGRVQQLAKLAAEARRRVELVPLDLSTARDDRERHEGFAQAVRKSAQALHRAHCNVDPKSGKRVSFGLVRMANIEPLYEVALALYRLGAPEGVRIHLCIYHSQFPLLLRSAIEQRLDAALKRDKPDKVFGLPDVREHIDRHPEADHLFIVLGSPVTEVGRDHDYDWAVVEPSSLRSLIQLLGRVRRHRPGPVGAVNVHVFSRNLRSFKPGDHAAFCRPGYEEDSGPFRLKERDLRELLDGLDVKCLDARPRIVEPAEMKPQARLADLEHARTKAQVLPQLETPVPASGGRRARASALAPQRVLNAASWWREAPQDALTTAFLPQQQRFRDDSGQHEVELVLKLNDDGDAPELAEVADERVRRAGGPLWRVVERARHKPVPDDAVQGPGITPWGATNYMEELDRLAQALDKPPAFCALRYGAVTVRRNDKGWRFHPALGFTRAKE